MRRSYFGTDGVRGRVGSPPMTPDFLTRLGFAAGLVLNKEGGGEVLIGKDTRLSGYLVESALEAGFAAAGMDVLLSGPLPTSAVAYLAPALRLRAGAVVSASHNPHDDNGVKFFNSRGKKLDDKTEAAIEKKMRELKTLSFSRPPGRARRLDDALGRYIEFCKSGFPSDLNLRGLKIVADCANGAAYAAAPAVLHELGADVTAIGASPDGTNINRACGVLHPRAVAAAVRETGADVGITLDGDADRVMMVDGRGRVYDGDALLFILADNFKWLTGEEARGVCGTVMSNLGLQRALEHRKIGFFRAPVGDRYVTAALESRGWMLGGEPSGHILLRHRHHTGDGVITALQTLAVMLRRGKSLAQLLRGYRPLPQASASVPIANRRALQQSGAIAALSAAAQSRLGEEGRVLARFSGTENVLRVMVECPSQKRAANAAAALAAKIKTAAKKAGAL